MKKVIIIVGSVSDMEFARRIENYLKQLEIDCEIKVASAHRNTKELLALLEQYEKNNVRVPIITVAGKLDALSGIVAANTINPVIACPPDTDEWDKLSELRKIEIFCSLDVPSVATFMLAIGSKNAAIQAAKILAPNYKELYEKLPILFKRSK